LPFFLKTPRKLKKFSQKGGGVDHQTLPPEYAFAYYLTLLGGRGSKKSFFTLRNK